MVCESRNVSSHTGHGRASGSFKTKSLMCVPCVWDREEWPRAHRRVICLYNKAPTDKPSGCRLSTMQTCSPSVSGVSEIAAFPYLCLPLLTLFQLSPLPPPPRNSSHLFTLNASPWMPAPLCQPPCASPRAPAVVQDDLLVKILYSKMKNTVLIFVHLFFMYYLFETY